MNAQILSAAVAAVCPVISVRVGSATDRATWSYIPSDGATGPQITAANNVIANISPTELNIIPFSQFIGRWNDAEYTLLMQRRATAIGAGNIPLVRQWDQATATGLVDLNSPAAQNFKTAIVAAGILTQVRADAIFS